MRIVQVSALSSPFDLTGTCRAGLYRKLAEIRGIEMTHVIIATARTFEALLHRKKLVDLGGWLLQTDAMLNVLKIEAEPQRRGATRESALNSRRFLLSLEATLGPFLEQWQPDVVHVWGAGQDWQSCALRLGEECRATTVLTYDAQSRPKGTRLAGIRTTVDLADIVLATSQCAARQLRLRRPEQISPFLDTEFWSLSRVTSSDLRFWDRLLGARRVGDPVVTLVLERLDRAFLRRFFKDLAVLSEMASARAVRAVVIADCDLESARDRINQLARERGVLDRVALMGIQPRALVRALYEMSRAVIFAPSCTTARWSLLEVMKMGCVPIAAFATPIAEPVENGANGFTYHIGPRMDLIGPLRGCIERPDERAKICQMADQTTQSFNIEQQARDCLRLYQEAVESGARRRTGRRAPRLKSAPSRRDWVQNTVLAVDLDLTLLRPRPADERPTAFPLQSLGVVNLTCDLGPTYCVRPGLEALEQIFRLPWKGKVVYSMADQDKVDEVTRCVTIGGKTLADWMDACVGNEILEAFAESRGVDLRFRRERSLNNPHGRLIRSKPSRFLQLQELSRLGRALAGGNRKEARRIAVSGALSSCFGLCIDDNPYLEPTVPEIACYQVLPFIEIEDYELVCRKNDLNSPLIFNFLDHLWRAASAPFHFLVYLLNRRLGWNQFRQELNTEIAITDAVRYADTFRQFSWMRIRAFGCARYRRYLETRAALDRKLDLARYREHARVYRALASDHVARDVHEGWAVLFLGRDMEYAHQFVSHLYPEFVAAGKVALLPLSRAALEHIRDEDLVHTLYDYLPDLKSAQNRGVRIYDVGYHGRIPSHIARAMRQLAWTFNKSVEAALLTCCSCVGKPNETCMGVPLRFCSRHGPFAVSRNFGISIERCPHRTGTVEQIIRSSKGLIFRFAQQAAAHRERAIALESFMKREALELRDQLPEHPHPVGQVAYEAFQYLLNQVPHELRHLRRIASALFQLSRLKPSQEIRLVVFPFCGFDLLTPLVCFPNVERVILVDTMPTKLDWEHCNFEDTSSYVAELAALPGAGAVHGAQSLERLSKVWSRRFESMEEAHGHALISTASLLSLARLLPATEKRLGDVQVEGSPNGPQLAWWMDLNDGRRIRFEYIVGPADLADPWLRAAIRFRLLEVPSVLILRHLRQLSPTASNGLLEWSRAAALTLHDQSAKFPDFLGRRAIKLQERESGLIGMADLAHAAADLPSEMNRLFLRALGRADRWRPEGHVEDKRVFSRGTL